MSEQPSTDTILRIAEKTRRADEESSRTNTRRQITPAPEVHRQRDFVPQDTPCELHSMRLQSVETKIESLAQSSKEHGVALSDGKVQFAEIRKDLASVTTAVNGVSANINRGVWLVLSTVILAILAGVVVAAKVAAHP